MLPEFMLCHSPRPFSFLNQNEWQKEIAKYPDLFKKMVTLTIFKSLTRP